MHHLDTGLFNAIESLDWPLNAVIRLLIAAVCGGLVGLEREVRGRQAGFRTNLLVCLGSAMVMVVSTRIAFIAWPHSSGYTVSVDPSRIAYGVMTGIGFLGAGAIIKGDGMVRGLTTAAGLWCVAALGLAAGLGLYLFALAATVLVVAALWGLDYVERLLPRMHYRTLTLRRNWEAGCVGETVARIRESGHNVSDWSFERMDDAQRVDVHLRVAFRTRRDFDEVERRLPQEAGCELVAVRKG